jgi:hypothetical protein
MRDSRAAKDDAAGDVKEVSGGDEIAESVKEDQQNTPGNFRKQKCA